MLAIIIPFYKISFFEKALASLASQTNKNFSVYIGNDASPDDPAKIIESFGNDLKIIYKKFDDNLGGLSLTRQWARCINMVQNEEWLMLLGDDDELSENCVELFYSSLHKINQADCKVVRLASILDNVIDDKRSNIFQHPIVEKATDFFYRRLTGKTRSSLSEYIFRTTAYRKYGFHNYKLGWYSDDRAWLEFSEFGSIYSLNSAHAVIRFSRENISTWNFKTEEKLESAYMFFRFLISTHLGKFKKFQRKDLLRSYESLVYRNKKANIPFYFHLITLFLLNLHILESLKFTRRFLLYKLEKNV